MRDPKHLTPEEQAELELICLSNEMAHKTYELTQLFMICLWARHSRTSVVHYSGLVCVVIMGRHGRAHSEELRMHSTAPDVVTYLEHVPPERVACLGELRQLCRKTLIEYEEGMDYGMPCYKKQGRVEVAFASQKRSIALYIAKQAVVDA